MTALTWRERIWQLAADQPNYTGDHRSDETAKQSDYLGRHRARKQ